MNHRLPKFIFFDLGNVLMHFDHDRAVRQLAVLADKPPQTVREIVFESSLQADYERGKISTAEFCDSFRQQTGCSASDDSLCLAASDIFWLNVSIMPLLVRLRRANLPIGILSNTCEAHWQFLTGRFPFLSQLLPIQVLSFEEKSTKPQAKIFAKAALRVGCPINELFFVDDLVDNVQGAIDVEVDAVVFESAVQLEKQLRSRGIRF